MQLVRIAFGVLVGIPARPDHVVAGVKCEIDLGGKTVVEVVVIRVVVGCDEFIVLVQPEIGVGSVLFAGSVGVAVDGDECSVGVDGEVEIGSGFDLYGVGVHGDTYNGHEYGRPVEPERYSVEVSCHLVR